MATALRCATFAVVALVNLAAVAQPTASGNRSGPPEQAIAACKSLQAGSDCHFTGSRGDMTGSCWAPQGKPLACRPKDAPPGGQAKPARLETPQAPTSGKAQP